MKAAVFDGHSLSIKELPMPSVEEGFVRIKILAAGICGTDLAIVKGYLPTPTPLILGHEFIGKVVEVGKNVNPSWLGKRVAVEINARIDHNCFYCKRKMFTQCLSRKAIGIDIDGGFAEYISVEDYLLHELPDSINDEEATFIEPLAAAFQTFERMPLEKDDNLMVIFGLGKMGLLVGQVAKLKGLEVWGIDGSEKKLALAKQLGFSKVWNRHEFENIGEIIKKEAQGIGADIVVDTSGNPEALKDVVTACRTRGKIHMKSTHGLATPMNITDLVVREITVYTSRCGPFEKAIQALEKRKINVSSLISGVFSLEQIQEAIDAYNNRDFIKAVLKL